MHGRSRPGPNAGLRLFPETRTGTGMVKERKNPGQDFSVSIQNGARDDELVVAVRGEIDMLTAPALEEELEDGIGKRPEILVVDLSGVTFLDSSGCNALIRGKRRADAHAIGLELAGLSPSCRRVLEIGGLLDLFTIRP